ncbi:MAG: sigma-54 dependent transcriptional regulator [Planctomycetota bacterium]
MRPKILIVDDESDMRWVLRGLFQDAGFEVADAQDGKLALDALETFGPDVILTDVRMPNMDGRQLLRESLKRDPNMPVILLSALEDIETAVTAMKEGAFDYLAKPFETDRLLVAVRRATEQRGLRLEVARLRGQLADRTVDFGPSPHAQELDRTIDLVAGQGSLSILITGDSGTGKEVVAREIHQRSEWAQGPFVAVDCGALPEPLMESQLFGHKKGSFTGADRDQPGLFRMADGGTLFLDELGNLPPSLQAKLLRALQERTVTPVGGGKAVPFNARLIVATNTDLHADVDAGRFRLDLYHRIAEFEIAIHPLRERPEDAQHFAAWFLEEANQDMGRRVDTLSEAAQVVIASWPWPGNLRELRNAIRRAVVVCGGRELDATHLQLDPQRTGTSTDTNAANDPASELASGDSDLSLTERIRQATDALEAEVIRQALAQASGNKAAAARALQIDYTTLHRKLKKHGLLTMAERP